MNADRKIAPILGALIPSVLPTVLDMFTGGNGTGPTPGINRGNFTASNQVTSNNSAQNSNTMTYVAIGAGVLGIIGILVAVFKR